MPDNEDNMREFKFFNRNEHLLYPEDIGSDPFTQIEYNEGWCASIEGRGSPYDIGTRAHEVWTRGYNDQMEHRRRSLIELTNIEDNETI